MTQAALAGNTHFVFDHKVFEIEGCYFALIGSDPALHMRLGEIDVSVTFPQLRSEFEIDKSSPDGRMLALVADALRFVRKIRPNDSIPTELLDGKASWSVDPKHEDRAKWRVMRLLALWLYGDGADSKQEVVRLLSNLDEPSVKKRLQEGFEALAESLGYGRHRKDEVADRVDQLATELSYIEALRDRVQGVVDIRTKIAKLSGYYRQDPLQTEELMRIDVLIHRPLKGMASPLDGLYAQMKTITDVLQNFSTQVDAIRQVRDDLRVELIDWDPVLAEWKDQPADMSPEALATAKRTYRFLAQNYQQSSDWASAS